MQKVTLADAEKRFQRMFSAGRMRRIPRGKADTILFLALAASTLDPRETYSEPELNRELREWMADFVDARVFDHVTVRRFLVDYRYLLRDAHGTRYTTNQAMISHAIEPEVRSIQLEMIFQSVEKARARRKRAATRN